MFRYRPDEDGPMQKEGATVLGGCQNRRGKIWRIAAVFAASGALALSGCASGGEPSGPATDTAAAAAAKVDEIANTVPEEIKSSGKLIVGVNIPYTPNEFKDRQRQDRRLRRRSDERDRGHPRPDGGVPGGRLRQDHPLHPGWHLQRRHVVVHRHQGARGDGRLRHLLLGRHRCGRSGRAPGSIRTTPAARRSRCRPPPPRRPRSCRPRARRAPTRASRRSRSCRSTGRTRRPTP